MSSTASVFRSSAGVSMGSRVNAGRTPYRFARMMRVSAALVREPSSSATVRISSHGTLLNSVTLSTGPREPMAMPGMQV